MTGAAHAADVEVEEGAAPQANILRRFLQGDLASLRVLLGLAVIWIIFQSQNDRFLSATNLTNLMLQITAVGLISVGIVYVLLLGEIDLSVGAVSGLSAAVMAVLNVKHGWDPYLAIAAGVATGMAIGLLQGALFTRFGVPSFVVTLAGLLAWQGALLYVLGETGTVNVTDGKITGLANTFYSDSVGWIFVIAAIAIYAGVTLWGYRERVKAGLSDQAIAPLVIRVVVAAIAAVVAISILNSDRGLPLAVLILLAFVIGMQYVATRTRFGRHVFAVGGNDEAARRAGIGVTRIRIIVFGIAGTMAAIGGILAASRLLAVNQTSGGSDLLLLAIAGPVIAGTSLFGGRGSVWSALLGALVIGSISNGMDLLAYDSDVKFMVTGAVLLAAAIVDSLARRQRQAQGRV
jgi:D-xylose transport system permease protein